MAKNPIVNNGINNGLEKSAKTAAEGPGFLTKAADTTAGVLGTVANVGGFLPMLAGGIGMIGGGVAWIGSKIPFGGIVEKSGRGIQAPGKYLNEAIMEKAPYIDRLGSASQWLADKTGVTGWRIGTHERRAVVGHALAKHAGENLFSHIPNVHADVATQLRAMQNAMGAHHATVDIEAFNTAHKALDKLAGKHNLKPLRKPLKQFSKHLLETAEHSGNAAKWRDVRSAMASRSIGSTVEGTAFTLGSALGVYGVARSFSQKLDSLKEMHAAITGQNADDISNTAILTGNVSKSVADARSHLLKEHVLRGAIEGLGLFLTARGFARNHFSMKSFLIPQAANMAADAFMGEAMLLQTFKPINDAYKRHEPLSQETYAALILAASKELQEHGRVGENIAMELAGSNYVKADPAQILRDADSGVLSERVHTVIKAHTDHKAIAPAPAQEQVVTQQHVIEHKLMQRPAIGHYTKQLAQAAEVGLRRGVVPPVV